MTSGCEILEFNMVVLTRTFDCVGDLGSLLLHRVDCGTKVGTLWSCQSQWRTYWPDVSTRRQNTTIQTQYVVIFCPINIINTDNTDTKQYRIRDVPLTRTNTPKNRRKVHYGNSTTLKQMIRQRLFPSPNFTKNHSEWSGPCLTQLSRSTPTFNSHIKIFREPVILHNGSNSRHGKPDISPEEPYSMKIRP